MLGTMYFFMNARKHKIVSGAEEMVGSFGFAVEDFENGEGFVRIHGERWQARCKEAVSKDNKLDWTNIDADFKGASGYTDGKYRLFKAPLNELSIFFFKAGIMDIDLIGVTGFKW